MTITVALRPPATELQQRYREEGHWIDVGLGAYLDLLLDECAANEVRIWSDVWPARTTMGEVHASARRFAAGLHRQGIRPGDVVTYQLPNRLETLIVLYGIALAGAVVVPIVHFYGHKELQFILGQLASKLHVTSDTHVALLDDGRDGLDALEHIVLVGEERRDWTTPFAELLDGAPLADLPSVDPMAPAVIGYTSGTTADPKGVVHTSNSYVAEARQVAAYDVAGRAPMLTAAPLAHAMGMTSGALLPLTRRHPAHIIDRWDADRVLTILEEEGLSCAGGAPYFLVSLFDHPRFGQRHIDLIERTGLGGAPVPVPVVERAEHLGIAICRSYGSTEHPTSAGSDRHDSAEHRNRSDGRAMAGCELRVVDEDGRDLPPGAVGEVLSRGPDLFFGYTDASLTASAIDADGWYHTDDLARMDAEGYITITDRKKDIIIRGGENVSAVEVEEVLLQMPGVAEVAVVAAPDDRFGERVCAVVRSAPGAEPPSMDGLRAHFGAAGIARQKWPEHLRVVDDFPRTPSGKIKKHAIRDELRESRSR